MLDNNVLITIVEIKFIEGFFGRRKLAKYEVCPESIGPTFMACCHLPDVQFMRSVSLFTKLFLSSADFVIVENE